LSSKLSKINFALILLIGFVVFINESEQYQQLERLYESFTSKYTVDFSVSEVQSIDRVFLLTNASQKKHLTGIEFSGRVINTQSIDHLDVHFELSVDDKNKEFTINKISSGNSTGFSVYIPDIDIERARYAKINAVGGNVTFFTK